MEEAFIMCPSVTRAQRAKKLLEERRIPARLLRAPAGASAEGCGYSLKVRAAHLTAVMALLRPLKLCSGRVVRLLPEGGFEEVLA